MFKNFTKILKYKYQIPCVIGIGLYNANNLTYCYGGYDSVNCFTESKVFKGKISGKTFNQNIESETLPTHKNQIIILSDLMESKSGLQCNLGLNKIDKQLDESAYSALYDSGSGLYFTNPKSSYRHGDCRNSIYIVKVPDDAELVCSHIGCHTTRLIIDHEVDSLTEFSELGYKNMVNDIYDITPNKRMINNATLDDLIIGLRDSNISLSDIPKEKKTFNFYKEVYARGLIKTSDIPYELISYIDANSKN